MSKPRALDLFCKAGGASMGLSRAGFDVVGVDIEPQISYPFLFIQADALDYPLEGFDFIWASPVCKKFTTLRARHKDITYPDQIAAVRARLSEAGVPFVIENVVGAPLINPVLLCGSSFGLNVRRHRCFEVHGFTLHPTLCRHELQPEPIDVTGTGGNRAGPRADGKGGNPRKPRGLGEARRAMGIYWMSRPELSQAIPPAYSEYVGRAALRQIQAKAA